MDTIRLLIRQCSAANHRSIEAEFRARTDVCIVGEVAKNVELLVAIRDTGANAVLLDSNGQDDAGMLSHLFSQYPEITMLAMPADASMVGKVFIEQRCRYRIFVSDCTPEGIVRELCDLVREPLDLINLSQRSH